MLLHSPKPTTLLRLLGRPIGGRHAGASTGASGLLSPLLRRLALHVLHRFLARYRERVDAKVLADGTRHEDSPPEIYNHSEEKVRIQVDQLDLCTDGGETQARQVSEDSAANEREQHDGPVREGLARQVREDHLGGHAAEDEAHGQAEQHEMIFLAQGREGAVEPEADGEEVDCEGCPLKEDGRQRKVLSVARLDHVFDASWDVDKQPADDDQYPHIAHGKLADLVGVAECVLLAQNFNYRCCPNLGAVDTREGHDGGRDEQTFRRTVEVAQV